MVGGRSVHVTMALGYAARGWAVFPLRAWDKRPAAPAHALSGCVPGHVADPRCAGAGRHVSWAERATTQTWRIEAAWSAPGRGGWFGVGIACGPSGLVVVDLDTPDHGTTQGTGAGAGRGVLAARERAARVRAERLGVLGLGEGADGWSVLEAVAARAGGRVPGTYTVATPSGGAHLYYTVPDGVQVRSTASVIGPGVDTRADGGYVVAPPSALRSGVYRLVQDVDPVPAPTWLLDLLATPAPAPAPAPGGSRAGVAGSGRAGVWDRVDAYLSRALGAQLEHLASAPVGARNRALYICAVAMGRLIAGEPGRVDFAETVERELTSCALAVGLGPGETASTIASGLAAGARSPRPVPAPRAA